MGQLKGRNVSLRAMGQFKGRNFNEGRWANGVKYQFNGEELI
jgi:hypothetical protein